MFTSFEDYQKYAKEQMDALSTTSTGLTRTVQQIATEASDYSKKSLEQGAAALEKLFGAKSLEKAFEIQSEYAKGAYEAFVAQATKMGDLYTTLAKDAFKPMEGALAKANAAAK